MSGVRIAQDGSPLDTLTRAPSVGAGPRLWWLGQAGFALESAGTRILIDPYLSDSLAAKYRGRLFPHTRLHPAPIDPATITGVSAVLHTHAHTDHLDPWTIRDLLDRNSPRFVAPEARRDVALERGIPEKSLIGAVAGDRIGLPGVTVDVVPAAHETREHDQQGRDAFLGYVVDLGGVRVYHSGDCVPYPEQAELLRDLRVDVALLPINGRDAYRTGNGVPGNFTVEEAVALCEEVGIAALVGHHFGLFDFNTIDPDDARSRLRRSAHRLDWIIPDLGAGYRLETASAAIEGGAVHA